VTTKYNAPGTGHNGPPVDGDAVEVNPQLLYDLMVRRMVEGLRAGDCRASLLSEVRGLLKELGVLEEARARREVNRAGAAADRLEALLAAAGAGLTEEVDRFGAAHTPLKPFGSPREF
jgi:hypothetical protein